MSSSRYEYPVMLVLTYDVSKGHDVEGGPPPPQPGKRGYGHQATHYGTQGVGTTCNWGHLGMSWYVMYVMVCHNIMS